MCMQIQVLRTRAYCNPATDDVFLTSQFYSF